MNDTPLQYIQKKNLPLPFWGVFVMFFFFVFSPLPVSAALPGPITLKAGEYQEALSLEDISRFTHLDTKIVRSPKIRSEIEDISHCPHAYFFCEFSLSRHAHERVINILTSTVDTLALENFITELKEKTLQEPSDARFGVVDGKVVITTPEKNGYRLKEKEAMVLLLDFFQTADLEKKTIVLPTEIIKPKLTADDRERLGLHELIGEGKTDFRGSPKNRIYNIKRALQQFENIIIAPGEEFSFVKYLGEVDGEHGYLPELVIKHNETVPEFGGGICQVSSTVFRAAIHSGMKITERRNHAYPVRYYRPYGMDATIYIPKPDLAFVNNTPGAILMQPTIEGTELTFRFYGTKDGRAVSIDGPHVLQSNPDGSMKTVFSQLVTDTSGNIIINDSFWSNYKSPALFPHPGEEPLKEKPSNWSKKQWEDYKKIHS
ncbi:MAG: VanW family protein [Candidatus Moranbacteria bacterium]|nr:VanW family protein [Candidatus Moranbacteria bacterium]